jgi:hypothetical protein
VVDKLLVGVLSGKGGEAVIRRDKTSRMNHRFGKAVSEVRATYMKSCKGTRWWWGYWLTEYDRVHCL